MGRKIAPQVSKILPDGFLISAHTWGLLWLLVKLLVPRADGVFVNEPAQLIHAGQKEQVYYKNSP